MAKLSRVEGGVRSHITGRVSAYDPTLCNSGGMIRRQSEPGPDDDQEHLPTEDSGVRKEIDTIFF